MVIFDLNALYSTKTQILIPKSYSHSHSYPHHIYVAVLAPCGRKNSLVFLVFFNNY